MMPGATAFTRMPRLAYSIASDLVAASRPPLVRDASTDGTPLMAWSTRLVVMFTTWPPPCFTISAMARCVMWKKPARLTPSDRREVGLGVLGERLGDEDAGVVDQRIDAAEPGHGFGDHALGGLRVGDVAGDGENVRRRSTA